MITSSYKILLISAQILLFLCTGFAFGQQSDPNVQSVVNAVNIDSIAYFIMELSGEIETTIDGISYQISSRNKYYEGNEKAASYLKQKLQSYGLNTQEQIVSATCKNIIAEQTGQSFPDKKYIICAHYDSQPQDAVSPGADDNASGVSVVIEAARILSKYETQYTVVYALWDEEEYGFIGSLHYARTAVENDDTILGVINLDMIGWDSNDDGKVDIVVDTSANSIQLADATIQVNGIYDIGLDPSIYKINLASDQWSFWHNGYKAILIIENRDGGDFNDYYHSKDDLLVHLNQSYLHNISKLSIAALASLASIDTLAPITMENTNFDYALYQNYPNPFNSTTMISYSIPKSGLVILKVYDVLGREVQTLVDEIQEEKKYSIIFDANILSSGLYYYRLQMSNEFMETKKMLLIR